MSFLILINGNVNIPIIQLGKLRKYRAIKKLAQYHTVKDRFKPRQSHTTLLNLITYVKKIYNAFFLELRNTLGEPRHQKTPTESQ